MAGKNWYYDCYDLRKFNVGEIDTFIDIGANNGSVSMMMKILQPRARLIAIEACKETFEILQRKLLCWSKINIEAYNFAYGDGKPMCIQRRSHDGMNRFFCEEEKKKNWWPKNYEYTIESKTLAQIFSEYKIDVDKPYIIKMDIEGGERFVLEQGEEARNIFRGAVQVVMELHLGLGGTGEEWSNFFQSLNDTHELRIGNYDSKDKTKREFVYKSISKFVGANGWHTIELINRNWIYKLGSRVR